jgi:hypothetical protein
VSVRRAQDGRGFGGGSRSSEARLDAGLNPLVRINGDAERGHPFSFLRRSIPTGTAVHRGERMLVAALAEGFEVLTDPVGDPVGELATIGGGDGDLGLVRDAGGDFGQRLKRGRCVHPSRGRTSRVPLRGGGRPILGRAIAEVGRSGLSAGAKTLLIHAIRAVRPPGAGAGRKQARRIAPPDAGEAKRVVATMARIGRLLAGKSRRGSYTIPHIGMRRWGDVRRGRLRVVSGGVRRARSVPRLFRRA